MTLGEALTLRSTQAHRLAELSARIQNNVTAQEGDPPTEDAKALIEEWTELSEAHATLVLRINKTNIESGLSELLVQREHLRRLHGLLASVGRSGSSQFSRYLRSEIKMVTLVDVAALNAQADEITEEARRLDAQIQERNWKTELVS